MTTRRFIARRSAGAVLGILWACVVTPANAETVPALSLREALDRAFRYSPALLASRAKGDQSNAAHDEAKAALMPSLQGVATFTELDADRVVGGRIITYASTGSAALVGMAPLFDAQRWVRVNATERQAEVAHADTNDTRRHVVAEVASTYLAVNTANREVEAARVALDHARRHLEIARTRRVAGAGSSVDELRAQQEVDRLGVDLASARRAVDERQETLGLLIGAGGPIDASEQPTFAAAEPARPDLFEARSDLQVARARLAVADYVRRTTWMERWPSLVLVGSAFVNRPGTGLAPGDGWSLQVAVSGRLLDGGDTAARSRLRDAAEEEAKTTYEARQRFAGAEVRRTETAVQLNTEALASAERSATSARQVLDLVSAAYREGAQTNIEVIDAERRFHDATLGVARAQQALEQSRLDLLLALGQMP